MVAIAQPSHGQVCWVPKDEYGNPRIKINGKEYTLTKTKDGKWELSYINNKWEMICYVVTPRQSSIEPWTCTCPFAKERLQGGCKHGRGLRAAMSKLNYPL